MLSIKAILNLHWYFESILSKNIRIGYTSIFQKPFTSLIICFLAYSFLWSSFLKTGVYGNLPNSNDLLNSWCKKGVDKSNYI